MRRWLQRGFASLWFAGLSLLPAVAHAETVSEEVGVPSAPKYLLPTVIALVITIAVMAVVCMPSRKGSD